MFLSAWNTNHLTQTPQHYPHYLLKENFNTHLLKKQNFLFLLGRPSLYLVVVIIYHLLASPIPRYFVAEFHCMFDRKLSIPIEILNGLLASAQISTMVLDPLQPFDMYNGACVIAMRQRLCEAASLLCSSAVHCSIPLQQ